MGIEFCGGYEDYGSPERRLLPPNSISLIPTKREKEGNRTLYVGDRNRERQILEYDKDTGTLSLDVSKNDLEKLFDERDGKNLTVPMPPYGRLTYYTGIKEIRRLYEEGVHLVKLS